MWTSQYDACLSVAHASYPVFVHRLARLLHASFRPRLQTSDLAAVIALALCYPSPPSGWERTFTSKLLSMPSTQRSRWRGGRYRVGEVGSLGSHRPINCGSQGGPCDPSTKNHAGGTPAASLLRGYHTLLHPRGRKVRTTLPLLSGPSGSAAHPGIPSPTLRKAEVVTRHGDEPSVCPAVFLHPDAEEAVEHCRHSVSEENSSPARHSQPGGSGAAHRRGLHSVSSHPAHDPLRHRSPQRRVDAPKD